MANLKGKDKKPESDWKVRFELFPDNEFPLFPGELDILQDLAEDVMDWVLEQLNRSE
ncbi:MAG: hypothetical protein HOH20_12520 [Rhodospirillaceae bacterium]|jgi:hypothetical protein|nr:hypothetical protein [Rhodospirillaceae bacterium]MBT5566917.1 hypothetical protein [Rhodospirillaceae bacterium]MBT6090396.1 hypothetical protein [Rhodospirillaceae bacterium]